MRREITGYSIRSRGETGTGLMFFVILLLPFVTLLVVFGPAGTLQFLSPVLDAVLQRVGAPSSVTNARAESPQPSIAVAPIRLPVANWEVKDGHFFTQMNGQPPLTSPTGFLVSNAAGIPFWQEFQRLGGEAHLGYPMTQRFAWKGGTVQIFQRGVMQSSGGGAVSMVNVMDELTEAGHDGWLVTSFFIPRSLPANFGEPSDPIAVRMALVGGNPAIESRFKSTPDALALYGLPTSEPTTMNEHVVTMRTQRTALHFWKADGPWGKANDVTIANAGQIALEAGLFPGAERAPEAPPPS